MGFPLPSCDGYPRASGGVNQLLTLKVISPVGTWHISGSKVLILLTINCSLNLGLKCLNLVIQVCYLGSVVFIGYVLG